jgi:hypothetical protein
MDFYKKNEDGEEVSVDVSCVYSGVGCSSLYEAMSGERRFYLKSGVLYYR